MLNQALQQAASAIKSGERDTNTILNSIRETIGSAPLARIDYVEIVDFEDLEPVNRIRGNTLIAMAVYFGATRLIDNIIIDDKFTIS